MGSHDLIPIFVHSDVHRQSRRGNGGPASGYCAEFLFITLPTRCSSELICERSLSGRTSIHRSSWTASLRTHLCMSHSCRAASLPCFVLSLTRLPLRRSDLQQILRFRVRVQGSWTSLSSGLFRGICDTDTTRTGEK